MGVVCGLNSFPYRRLGSAKINFVGLGSELFIHMIIKTKIKLLPFRSTFKKYDFIFS